jgi:hypothetical protein
VAAEGPAAELLTDGALLDASLGGARRSALPTVAIAAREVPTS